MFIKDNFEGSLNSSFWSLKRIEHSDISFSSDIVKEGSSSLKITINPGDKKEQNTERSEISESSSRYLGLDTNIIYSFSIFFPKDFDISNNRFVFAQIKQKSFSSESPFISLRYSSGEFNFQIQHNGEKSNFKKKMNLIDKWTDFRLNYELRSNSNGFAKLYVNNQEYVEYKGPLGYQTLEDKCYFKMGIYRDSINTSQSIYFDSFKREWC